MFERRSDGERNFTIIHRASRPRRKNEAFYSMPKLVSKYAIRFFANLLEKYLRTAMHQRRMKLKKERKEERRTKRTEYICIWEDKEERERENKLTQTKKQKE